MKEKIKQFKSELDHWLDGEKLQARHWVEDPNDGDCSFTMWYDVDESSSWKMETLLTACTKKLQFVINDKYVEFRKTQTEGKVVQVLSVEGQWVPAYATKAIA